MARQINLPQTSTALEKAKTSIDRVKFFDTSDLVRRDELGDKYAFEEAVSPADQLKTIFARLPNEALFEFPDNELTIVITQADNIYNLFQQILDFDPEVGDISTRKTNLINQLTSQYQPVFTALFPFISYSVARIADFDQLAADGRAAVQSVRDEVASVMKEIEATSSSANTVLQEVRDAAAEQGVTQQAKYFEQEASIHETQSKKWRTGVFVMAGAVTAYAGFTLFLPAIPLFKADTIAEAIQLTTSKILIFVVLASMLLLSIRNFSAHKHNAIVNKHRQNALMTYTTLAEAGRSSEARDTVLQHAAAAIYAPNDTGYVKQEERGYGGSMPVSVTPRFQSSAHTPSDG